MITSIVILAILGFCISLYAYSVENNIKRNPDYKPACDLSNLVSCSAPAKSKYSNLFYFSNAIVGMLFYSCIALAAYFNSGLVLLVLAIGGSIASLFLAYILFFKIRALCLLCVSTYIINFLIFIFVVFS